MSAPRFIRPGKTWLLTRRTTRRHYLLRPDADGVLQNIYWYVTAVFARKFGIEMHAVQMLSTHMHEVVTDAYGNLPAFLRERNRALANAIKCHHGWPEEVFQRAQASCVELCGAKAIVEKIAYTIANCVEAGLVAAPESWPGVTVVASEIGARIVRAHRPSGYFDPQNPVWPTRISIRIEMPKSAIVEYGDAASRVVVHAVERAIDLARRAAQAAGTIAGDVRRLLSVSPHRRARSPEPIGARNPTFATGGIPSIFMAARSERTHFYDAYRASRARLRKLLPDRGGFPEGSWRWVTELLGFPRELPTIPLLQPLRD